MLEGMLCVLLLGNLAAAPSREHVKDVIQKWRDEIMSPYNKDSSPGFYLPSGGTLRDQVGPNALPELYDVYATETNLVVTWCMESMVGYLSRFQIYSFSEVQCQDAFGRDVTDTKPAERPFLSLPSATWQECANDVQRAKRDLYLQWWARRDQFLKRTDAKEQFRAVTGKTPEEFSKFDWGGYRALGRVAFIYGIYNFPCYIDLVREDNNPVAFATFLRQTTSKDYTNLPFTTSENARLRSVIDRWPTRESKLRAIVNWWQEKGHRFTRLEDLYQAIDIRVTKIEEELKAKQKL